MNDGFIRLYLCIIARDEQEFELGYCYKRHTYGVKLLWRPVNGEIPIGESEVSGRTILSPEERKRRMEERNRKRREYMREYQRKYQREYRKRKKKGEE